MADLDALLIVVPVPYLRAVLADLPPGDAPLIFCSKGMEAGSFAFPIDVARELAPLRPHAVLSGPTFAHEVAAGLPRSEEHTSELQSLMRNSYAVFCLQKKNRQTIK